MHYFTERGWHIESDQYTGELLNEWKKWNKQGNQDPDMRSFKGLESENDSIPT